MKKNIFNIIIYSLLALFLISCQETESDVIDVSDNDQNNSSTIGIDDLGGSEDNLQEFFFDLDKSLNYQYNYYTVAGIGSSNTIDFPCNINDNDMLSLYSFPEFLVETKNCDNPLIVCEDDYIGIDNLLTFNVSEVEDIDDLVQNGLLDESLEGLCECSIIEVDGLDVRDYTNPPIDSPICQNSQFTEDGKDICESNGWIWFEEFIDCSLMDVNEDCVMDSSHVESLVNRYEIDFPFSYQNLDSLVWDVEANNGNGRYVEKLSTPIDMSTTIVEDSDIYRTSNRWTIVNEWDEENISGKVYIDHKQWNDTTLIVYDNVPDIIIDTTYNYTFTTFFDSLMYWKNSDCNNDGVRSPAEPFDDWGLDGCPDELERGVFQNPDGSLNFSKMSCGECEPIPQNDANGDGICDADPNGDNWNEAYTIFERLEGNAVYDYGEPFDDQANTKALTEVYYDINGNGQRDTEPFEPFVDLNCNNIYDEDGITTDEGNGIWDDIESYIDLNVDGDYDQGEFLFKRTGKPDQIIVNYDTNGDSIVDDNEEPTILTTISSENNSAMVYLNWTYANFENIIEQQEDSNYQFFKYTPIKELVTINSNEIIEDIPSELSNRDYNVTKTLWDNTGTDGVPAYDYDYNLFRYSDADDESDPGNLLKLVHPRYYYHYGYYEEPDELENGFYDAIELIDDIMIYTVSGNIRDGEEVITFEEVDVDPDNDGIINHRYEVTKIFEVDIDTVAVPLLKGADLGEIIYYGEDDNICSEGDMIRCFSDNLLSCIDGDDTELGFNSCGDEVESILDCSPDIHYPAYKITRTKEITLIGNAAKFGERNTIWLVKDIGIVKDKLEHRWTESDNSIQWKEFSRLELDSYSVQNNNSLQRIFSGYEIIEIEDFGSHNTFDNQPYTPKPTGIIQRSRTRNE